MTTDAKAATDGIRVNAEAFGKFFGGIMEGGGV